ncbi:MAG: ferredoxin [Kofleriaceae bacterium]
MRTVVVDLERCIRCGGCSTLAPGVFSVASKATAILRQPQTEPEWSDTRAASLACPTEAIAIAERA